MGMQRFGISVLLFFGGLSVGAAQGQMHFEKVKTVIGSLGTVERIVTVKVRKEDKLHGAGTMASTTIRYEGQISASPGEEIISNRARTLAAVNFRPATHTGVPYLFLLSEDGIVRVLPNFKFSVIALCHHPGVARAKFNMLVEEIKGNVVSLWAEDEENLRKYVSYRITVRVAKTGKMTLLHLKRL